MAILRNFFGLKPKFLILCSLAAYVKDIKQGFTFYYNKKYRRQGFFWGGRFKSLIVEDGKTLVHPVKQTFGLRLCRV